MHDSKLFYEIATLRKALKRNACYIPIEHFACLFVYFIFYVFKVLQWGIYNPIK